MNAVCDAVYEPIENAVCYAVCTYQKTLCVSLSEMQCQGRRMI